MKDVTSTSFGLLIAFLLPGIIGLYSLSFWSATLRSVFATFLTAQSSVGLFLLVLCAAVALGLQITAVRWLIFEQPLSKEKRLAKEDFAKLQTEAKLASFRAAVDEHYRYHQFWGGMAIVLPIGFFGLVSDAWNGPAWRVLVLVLVAIAAEAVTVTVARVAYELYVARAKGILSGS